MRTRAGIMATTIILTTLAGRPSAAHTEGSDLLARMARLDRALAVLGPKAERAATRNGQTLGALREHARDSAAWLDRDGAMFYVDPPKPVEPSTALPAAEAAALPYAETFVLHSNATASRKVFLDFDGHVVSGTAWNNSYTSGAPFTAEPYDSDGSPSTFSNAELDQIQATWQRVAEDYAPFDVDVTTQDPGAAGINRSSTSDTAFGTRVLITGTNTIFSSCQCGGVAYVGTIDQIGTNHNFYQPAFVFTRGVGYGAKEVSEAASHEAGHNLGLAHDGTSTTGYYEGHSVWAPIMGVGYYRPVSQWSKGEYTGANQTQDDFVIAAQNQIPLRSDDFGGPAAPSVLAGSPVSLSGVIGSSSDQDAFQFTTAAGVVNFTAAGASVGANIDIKLSLLDSTGSIVATDDPAVVTVNAGSATGLDASISATVSSGTYRIIVDGVGFQTPATGYTDYGSVGRYTLTGTFATSGANQVPTAVATATPTSGTNPLTVNYSGAGSSDPDGNIVSYSWLFSDSTTSTLISPSKVYSVAGTYNATLTVTDNGGATASTSVSVAVNPSVVTPSIKVHTITMSIVNSFGRRQSRAVVRVTDANGANVPGVTVSGNYTGIVTSTLSGTTSSNGTVTLTSPRTRASSGAFTFTIDMLTKSGYAYNPANNIEWTKSIALP
jgi:PKD repeat protein